MLPPSSSADLGSLAEGMAAVLRTAPPGKAALVREFLDLCANETLFPRVENTTGTSCAGLSEY